MLFYNKSMNRLNLAKQAFRNKDLGQTKRSHTTKAIKQHIFRHDEVHASNFNLPEIILGGQDGLVNVLGVILGVAAATTNTQIIIVAGMAATFAESFSMAAVAYTSKLAEADYYQSEYEREKWEIENYPEGEREEIKALYKSYGFKGNVLDEIITRITANKDIWLRVMMEQELKLELVNRRKAIPAAVTVGLSALAGSFIPLIPFLLLPVGTAILGAIIATSIVLFIAGYYKAKMTIGRSFVKMGLEMMIIGMLAAGVGYLVGSIFKV